MQSRWTERRPGGVNVLPVVGTPAAQRAFVEQSAFLLVFSDLDGTLLDHETYSFAPARGALALLAREGVPLVLCSSKTRAEIEALQQELGIAHPFICENGGAAFVPDGTFPEPLQGGRRVEGYEVIEFGLPYPHVVARLRAVASSFGIHVVGFNDLDAEAVARLCSLPLDRARRARKREYDEPFLVEDADPVAARRTLCQALEAEGLRCTSGGRFDHVSGQSDKARAMIALRALYRAARPERVVTVGLGDSPNDLALLREVDIPIVVRNRAGRGGETLLRELPGARVTEADGPSGWNEAIEQVVRATPWKASVALKRAAP